MNSALNLDLHHSDIETDDFTVVSMLRSIQAGDEVDNDQFAHFVNKAKEVIAALQGLVRI